MAVRELGDDGTGRAAVKVGMVLKADLAFAGGSDTRWEEHQG